MYKNVSAGLGRGLHRLDSHGSESLNIKREIKRE